MLVKDLFHLVEIFKLVEKDPGTKELYLDKTGAYLAGMHVGARRGIPRTKKLPLDAGISIDGSMLMGVLALMKSDAEVAVKQTDSSLILNAKGRRAILRARLGADTGEGLDFMGTVFDSSRLRKDLVFLRACAAEGVITPVLTGIRFSKSEKGVTLEATDAERRSGRVSLPLPRALKVSGQIVPAADLEIALSLLGTKISMQFRGTHLYLRDARTVIKLSLLQGKYPDLSKLPKPDMYKHLLSVSKTHLDTAIRAAILFDSDRLVTLVIKDRQAALLVRGQETGGFRQPIGRVDLSDIEIIFDAHWLDAAQYIGARAKLRYNDARSPVLFSGNKRLLWMSPIVQA
jgi:hypothetical protein